MPCAWACELGRCSQIAHDNQPNPDKAHRTCRIGDPLKPMQAKPGIKEPLSTLDGIGSRDDREMLVVRGV
jgi:hypothetical protein